MLLPFGRMLGWGVIFRAGSLVKIDRDIEKENFEPVLGWDGKPRLTADHTWCEVTYYPSQ